MVVILDGKYVRLYIYLLELLLVALVDLRLVLSSHHTHHHNQQY